MFSALKFDNKSLYLIDQTKLPHYQDWISCHSARDVAEAIRTMKVRGAPAIGCAAAYGVVLSVLAFDEALTFSSMRDGLEKDIDLLADSRPTAVNLFHALDQMKQRLFSLDRTAVYSQVVQEAEDEARKIFENDVATCKAIGAHGASLFDRGAKLMTHCNTGSLATAGYGTALGIIRSLASQEKLARVYANETRPYLQGSRLTAFELIEDAIPVTLECDSAAAYLMATKSIDGVVVGADRIAANGDTANKIGTYSLAVNAKYHQVPFYVAAPKTTIDPEIASGKEIPIELRSDSEVKGFGDQLVAPSEVAVWNPSFDITPADLITAIITEDGVQRPPFAF